MGFVGPALWVCEFQCGLKTEKHRNPYHSIKTHKPTFPDLDERTRISCNCGLLGLWVCPRSEGNTILQLLPRPHGDTCRH